MEVADPGFPGKEPANVRISHQARKFSVARFGRTRVRDRNFARADHFRDEEHVRPDRSGERYRRNIVAAGVNIRREPFLVESFRFGEQSRHGFGRRVRSEATNNRCNPARYDFTQSYLGSL